MFTKNNHAITALHHEFTIVDIPENFTYDIPPNSFTELKGEFLNFIDRKELYTRFKIDEKYSNPQGSVQGGIVAACIDDTYGPLGMVHCRKPVMSIDINVQYIRPVPLEQYIYVKTWVVYSSRKTIFLRSKIYNEKQKLLVESSTNLLIVK